MSADDQAVARYLQRGSISRRALLAGALGLGASALLAACGGDDGDGEPTNTAAAGDDEPEPTATEDAADEAASEPTATADASADEAAFPVTIDHAFGSTTIDEAPARVVSVDWNGADFALAVGVTPVGVREWLGGYPFQTRPWAQDEQGGVELETVGGAELDFEQIAALQPDLIIGLYAHLTEEVYATLSQIAPTIAHPSTETEISWEEQMLLTGRALGHEEEAAEIVAGVEERYEDARSEHPEFDGLTAAFVSFGPDGFWIFEAIDVRTQFLTSLGFQLPEETGQFSHEQADALELDAAVAVVPREQFESDPLYGELDIVSAGRVIYLDDWTNDLAAAIGFNSPLSLGYLLDGIVPMLAAAVDGEPEAMPADEATTRTVDTPNGPVEVPVNPQRVIALGEEFMLADILDLGIKPIASTSSLPGGFYALDEFDTSEIEQLSNTEPDIEHIVALQPDMLIAYTFMVDEFGHEFMSQLAPTVAIDSSNYRDAYMSIAATFGLEERAEERLAEYDANATEYGEELGASERTASVATVYSGASDITLWLDGPADVPQALVDMGFTLVPDTETLEPARSLNRASISLEQVELLTGDDLCMMQTGGVEGEAESLEEITASDLWQRIPAVQADRVHTFDRLGYPGVPGRIRLLDDIRAALEG